MTRTIAEWQAYIHDWANEKGWWTPQCKHSNVEENWSREGDVSYEWCLDCGAFRNTEKVGDNFVDGAWMLPTKAKERNLGELHMLFVTEVAEAYEEIRANHPVNEVYYKNTNTQEEAIEYHDKPEGVPTELADIVIRILDFCGHYGIDLEAEIERKMRYNETRAYRHGGKLA